MTQDPGLQEQRTTLAWSRTGLASAVVGGLLVRQAVHTGALLDGAAAAVGVVATLVVLGAGSRALRPLRGLPGEQRLCDHRGAAIAASDVFVLAVLTTLTLLPS